MASTYTQNSGIEKPGTGDQSGTWGVTTNTNFDIIDRAVHGQVSIAISGSTNLTTNDGSLSNGIAPVIILTGSPGATFELRVTPTDQKKHYTIKNETDGACRVIYLGVTYSASNGVEIAPNSTQSVTGDGGGSSGVFKSLTPSTDLINDLTPQLGGSLDVNGESIVSASNGNIVIAPHGTGHVDINSDLDVTGAIDVTGDLDVDNVNINGNAVTVTNTNANLTLAGNGTGKVLISNLSYPSADGTANQVLKTDGSGTLAFANAGSSLGSSLTLGNWTIEVDGSNNLLFKYSGDTKIRMTSAGALDVEDDVTAYSGI
jgi:hypothetical protein